MSAHNNAKKGDIAPSVLLPGDPLRAKFIAETYLEDAHCYNTVRNMLGYTGSYKGHKISVQGTGMGMPSISIYATELMNDYGCKNLIRIGTCGAIHHDIKVRDVIMATAACTDSAINKVRFNGQDYAPTATFEFALKAYQVAADRGVAMKSGLVFSADTFYTDDPVWYRRWAEYGVLAVEMEAAALFTIAAKYQCHALALLTVSDHILTGDQTTADERQNSFTQMMEIALDACVAMEDKSR